MQTLNTIAITVSTILTILSLLLIGWESRWWTPPMSNKEKISRSIKTGLGVIMFIVCSLTAFDLTKSLHAIENWKLVSYFGLLCIAMPLGLVATIGTFIGFTILDTLRGKS